MRNHHSSLRSVTYAYFVAFTLLGVVTASLGPTLLGLASQTGVNIGQISYLFATRSLGYLFGSLLGGLFYDRMPGHPVFVGALVTIGLSLAFVPSVTFLWLLLVVMFVIGVGEGLLDVGGNTLIVWLHGKSVAPYMNGLHFFFGLGAFLSPILVAQLLLLNGGIQETYWLFSFLVLPAIYLVHRVPSPKAPSTILTEGTIHKPNNLLIALVVCFMAFYVGAEVSFGNWIFTYGIKKGINEVNAAYLNSLFWGAFTLSRLVSIPVGARVQPRYILAIHFAGAILSLGTIFLWPANLKLLWLGSFGFGFSIAPIFPTMLTFAGRQMAVTGRVTSYFFLGATVGGMFLPWFIGQFLEKIGSQFVIQAIFVAILTAAFVFTVIFSLTDRKRN